MFMQPPLSEGGEIRVAIQEARSGESYPCPVCQTLSHWRFLGDGGKRGTLPFFGIFARGSGTKILALRSLAANGEVSKKMTFPKWRYLGDLFHQ